MPDENTQNPETDKTFTIDQEALEANQNTPAQQPTEAPATQDPANPLNTGNGTPEAPATGEAEAPIAETPAEPTPEVPVEAPATGGENLEQKLDEQLTEATTSEPEAQIAQDTTKSSKKYLIIIIVIITLLAGGYFVYTYFIAGPAETVEETETPPTNTLSPTDAMEELDEIVDELEDVYAPPAADEIEVFEEAVLEEVDDSFPTLTLTEPVEEVILEEPVLYEPLLGEPPIIDEPVIDESTDLKVLR
ncbi:MAG: hypothetical protein ABID64_03010 [Nitrospirota bacterium]